MEVWKDILGYEGIYQVSSFGRIKSLGNKLNRKEKLLKYSLCGNYYQVQLSMHGNKKSRTVHQLVAVSFYEHIPCGMEWVVNHKDLNKLNNHKDNLEIITQKENTNKTYLKYIGKRTTIYWCKKERNWIVKTCINKKTEIVGRFKTEAEAFKECQNRTE